MLSQNFSGRNVSGVVSSDGTDVCLRDRGDRNTRLNDRGYLLRSLPGRNSAKYRFKRCVIEPLEKISQFQA